MKLAAEEIAYVTEKLNTYNIKYQEVFDELKDHLITAIENLREQGDQRPVELLFNEVVETQFPGYWPFEDIAQQYRMAYQRKIGKAMWADYKSYFNPKTMPLIVLLLALSFYLPQSKPVTSVMMVLLLIVSAAPLVYVYRKRRTIKTDKGKHSLVKAYVTNSSNYAIILFNLLFNAVRMAAMEWKTVSFLNPIHYSPVICMLLLVFAFIYCLTSVRLSRHEFKIV